MLKVKPILAKTWIPIKSLGHANVYGLTDDINGGRVDLIDSGMYSIRSVHDLVSKLKSRLRGKLEIERIVITHFHADHMTGAAFLQELFSTEVYIGIGELEVPLKTGSPLQFIEDILELYKEHGTPEDILKEVRRLHPAIIVNGAYRSFSSLSLRPLYVGDTITLGGVRFRVVPVPGHTPGHILLETMDGSIAFAGDSILDSISPSIVLHSWDSDPLGDYIKSLETIATRNYMVVYTGHRNPILDPKERARELIKHHEDRLDIIVEILRREGSLTGYEIAARVPWRSRYRSWEEYPIMEKFFAIGEALAHLRRLYLENRVELVERRGRRVFRPL